MPLNESVYRRKQREEEERRRREQAVEIARGGSNNSATSPQTSSTSNSTNSSTSSRNSSYGSQTVSQTVSQPSTPAERDLFKITGRRHTVTDRRRGIDKNEKTQRTANISGQNRGLSRDGNDRFTNTVKGAGKQWLGGQLSGIGTTAQADIVNINSIRGAKAERENDYRLTSREEAEKREAESVNKSRTKDGVNLRDMERRYSLEPEGNVSDNYRKIVKGTQSLVNKGDSLIESGTQDIEKAKEGATDFEKFLIDNGAQLTQWAGDASLRLIPVVGQALSMGGFFNRAGGMSAYQGRQEGMNPDQQFKYYAGSGLMEVLSELTFQSVGALRATYGKGMFSIADKLTTKASTSGIVRRLLNNTELGKSLFINMARLGGNAVEEGLEEVETDLVDPLLKYFIKKSEDPRAEFEGWDFPQMGYDFLMGATMGGVLGVAEVPNRVKYELNIANSDAFNDGMTTSLIKQASVQGRQSDGGRLIPTNAEILAQQLQQQMDNNIPVQPAQIRMLQEAIGQSISENQKQLTRKMTQEYDKAQKSGDLVQMEGTRLESQGIDNASVKLYDDATEKARQVLGEDATQEEVEAVAGVTTGLASTNEIDTVLAKPELKRAVETIVNEGADDESAVSIPVNNAEARDVLENLTAVKRIANRNTILKDVQAKNAEIIKSSVDNMSEGGKNLFASRAEFAQDTIGGNRDRNLEIYRDRFSRLYTDGNTKGADFETSYKRIIGSLDSEALKSVFTEDFARQIFEEGKKAIVTNTAKETAKSRAEEYANRKGGLTFENNNENLISSRERDELQKFAERVGVEINVVKSLSKDASGKALMSRTGKKLVVNGKYQDGVIYIASDAQNKLITVAKHELTHHLKETSPEMYQKLEDFVFERWYHGNAEEMEDEIARYTKLYSGQGLDRAGIREEIIADASEAFFTDEGAIQDAISFSEKLGRAIHDGIKTMLDAFLGLQDADSRRMRGYGGFLKDLGILQEAERMWLEALEETQQKKRNARGGATTEATTESEAKHSLGYHAGDLGKSTGDDYWGQGYYRGTGHFGFGTYFVGDKMQVSKYGYEKRPVETVDFDKYNLFKPRDYEQGIRLHNALKTVDGYMERYGELKRLQDNWDERYYKTHGILNDLDDYVWSLDEEGETPSPELKAKIDKYISEMPEYYRDKLEEEAEQQYKRDGGEYDLEAEKYYVADDIIKDYISNLETDMERVRSLNFELTMGLRFAKSEAQIDNALQKTAEIVKAYPKNKRGLDSASTVFMKQLGYEGVDVRGIEGLDNTTYGSVIYDLKGEDLARKKEIGTAKYSVTAESDQAYMDAVNRGKMTLAQSLVDEKASSIKTIAKDSKGKPLHLYHGTNSFGFTVFKDSQHNVPFIYTSTDRTVSAHYAGDNHYASTRPIGTGYKTGNSIKDILENARNVLGADMKVMSKADKKARYDQVREEALKVADKLDELESKYSSFNFYTKGNEKMMNAVAWVENQFWTIRDGDYQYDFDNDSEDNAEWRKSLEEDVERFKDNIETVREYYNDNYKSLNNGEKALLSYLIGYDLGDVAIDIEYGMLRVATNEDLLSNQMGGNIIAPSELKENMDRIHNIGAYDMYGDLGDNPLEFDAKGAQFWAVEVPQMGEGYFSTDQICKWANENGYTSVIMHNIYDYGDKADNYVFFSSNQLKSADPVTYDDNGNVIPLSERFNKSNDDIRYSVSAEDQDYMDAVNKGDMETAQRMVDEQAKRNGYDIEYAVWRGDSRPYNVLEAGVSGGNLGTGLYFTPQRSYAERFGRGGVVRRFYLKKGKMFDYTKFAEEFNSYANEVAEEYGERLDSMDEMLWSMAWDEFIADNEYDSVKAIGVGGFSYGAEEIAVQEPWQAKSADPVTYDDNGNVIPLSERFNESNEDIRWSVSEDSEGNKLSEGQREYFGNSKVVDSKGNLKVMYHGTNNDFTVFDFSQGGKNGTALGYGIYMSPRTEESQMYGDRLIKSYVNITKPAYDNKKSIKPSALKKFIKATAEHEAKLLVDDEGYDNIKDAIKDTWVSNYEYTYDKPMSDVYTNVANSIIKRNQSDMDIIQECIAGMGIYNYKSIPTVYNILTETMGIDGFVTTKDGKDDVVLAFRSNQIKNVDNLNPTEDADIRYSIADRDDIENLGANVTDGGSVAKFSVESWNETDVDELRQKLIDAGNDPNVVDKWIRDVNSMSANIIRNRLTYKADRTHSALKNNSEYYYTLDLSTLCAKRKLYQGTFNAIMHSEGMENVSLLPKDVIHLRALMDTMGYEVPCGICYEESRKKNEPKFAKQWLFGYKTKTTEWAGYANMEHDDPYIPTLADVLTTDGRSMLQAQHPEVLEAYLTFQKGRGSANPKVSRLHTDYRSDILNMTKGDIENVIKIGGLRIQSFSDFELPHVLDMMQAVLDMSVMGLTSQAYTKVPAFAQIFGNTGIKINLSLIGKAVDGKLVFDDKEGIDHRKAFKLRKKFDKNVGTILVGANRESILLAWADPRIDMVIPFHRSGWSKAEFKALGLGGYEDFQAYQSERYILDEEQARILTEKDKQNPKKKKPHTYKAGETVTLAMAKSNGFLESKDELYSNDYWDGNLSGKENAEKYLRLCAEQHRRPVFYEFLQDNGDGSWSLQPDGSTDGYWKSLIDFKMYDSTGKFAPQEVVKPTFNMQSANDIMQKFEGDPDNLPVADDVVKQFVKDYKGGRKYKLVDDKKIVDKNLPKIDTSKFSVSEEDENAPTPKEYQSTIAKLEEKVADLKSEFKRTDLKTADPKQTRIQAGRLLKRHDSNLTLQGDVVDAFSKIHRLYKEKGMDAFDEASEIALETAKQVVDGIAIIHDEGMEQQKEIREFLKDNEIIISPYIEKNMDDFASFRKKNAFRLKLKKGEVSNLDKYIYPRLQELFPTAFPDEYYKANNKEGGENTDVLVDMLRHIGDVLDNPMYTVETITESTPEWKEYVSDIASDIMETAYGLQTKKTFADKKYEEKVRAVAKAREEALASRDRALAKQAERYETKISYLKQRNKDFKEETYERAEKKRRIAQIARIHKRLLEKLQEPKDTKHLPDGYAPIVSKVLSMFDFTTEGMDKWAERNGEPSKRYRYLDELRKKLEELSKEDSKVKDEGIEIDPELIELVDELKADIADSERLSDMDSAKLEDIVTLFRAFEHQINTYNQAIDDRNKQTVTENRDNFISETRDKKTRKDKQGTIGWLQRQLETNNTTPEDFFHLIGGTPEKLYKSIRKGFDKHILNIDNAMTFVRNTVSGKDAQKWSENVREYTTSFGDKIKLTDAQLMSIYCLSKREQAQQHMYSEKGGKGISVAPQKVGKGLKAEDIDRAKVVVSSLDIQKWISQLSDKQREVADQFQRYLSDEMSKLGNETALKLYGYKKFTEKNYFPIQSSENWLNSTFDFSGGDAVLKNVGMTKAVNKFANNPIVIDDIFTVASKHISTMSLYNSLVPPLTDFQRFWNSKDNDHDTTVKEEFERVYGKPALKYVDNFMRDLNGSYKRGFEVEGVDKLMSKYKQASIGLNLRVLFQQPTAVARAGAVMNPIYITKALGASTTTLKQNLKDMREHCPIALWKSWGFYNTDLARDMRSIMMDEKTLSDNFSKAYGIADDLTWSVIFKAVRYEVEAQNKNLEVGSDEYWEKVNERASEVFDRTQVVDSPFHRSQNMRAKDNLSKMVTAFMAEPTKTYNMLKTELTLAKREIQSGQKAQGIKRASRVVQVFVTNALLVSASSAVIDALRGVGGSGDDDKDKNWFERFLAHWWSNTKDNINPLGLLPVFKDVQSVVQGYDVTRMDMQAIGRMVKSLQYMGEYIKEPENSKYTLKNEAHYFLQQSAYLVGLPLANLERDTRGIAFSLAEAVGYDDLFFEEAKFKYQVNDKTKSMWADMYLDAKYKGNTALAKKIKDYITSNDAVTEEYIEEREKKYKKDNKSASQQHTYDSSIQTLETSPIWNTASEDNKEYYTGILENLSVGIENQSTEYVTKLAKNGLTNEQVILYKLALKKVDKPSKNGNYGSYTNAEKEDAIRLLERYYNLTQAQKDTLMGK